MKKDYTKKQLNKVVAESETYLQVLKAFNRNQSAASYKTLKRYLEKWSISTDHFLTKSEIIDKVFKNGKLKKYTNDEMFTSGSTISRHSVKKRIIQDNLIEYKCVDCGNDGNWMGKKITLILDHINGLNNDNRLENLRFLCPNCNATKPTHCLGSVGYKGKIDGRKIRYERPKTRKVKRPSKTELIKLLENNSYCGIGRKYGVSDNAVRKWVKKYEII